MALKTLDKLESTSGFKIDRNPVVHSSKTNYCPAFIAPTYWVHLENWKAWYWIEYPRYFHQHLGKETLKIIELLTVKNTSDIV